MNWKSFHPFSYDTNEALGYVIIMENEKAEKESRSASSPVHQSSHHISFTTLKHTSERGKTLIQTFYKWAIEWSKMDSYHVQLVKLDT